MSTKNTLTPLTIKHHNDACCDPIFDWDNKK